MYQKNISVTIDKVTLNMRGEATKDYSITISFADNIIFDDPIDQNNISNSTMEHEGIRQGNAIQGILNYDPVEVSSLVDYPLIVKIHRTATEDVANSKRYPGEKSFEPPAPVYNCLGVIDILPIFLGEDELHTTCRLEPMFTRGELDLLAWTELPCVTLTLRAQDTSSGSVIDFSGTNWVKLTVESAYGLPEIDMQYETGYNCHIGTVIMKQGEYNLTRMLYKNGIITNSPIFDCHSKWAALECSDGESIMSNFTMARGEKGLTNNVNIDLSQYFRELKLHQEQHLRVQWNSFHRILVDEDAQRQFINLHRCWPLELVVVCPAGSGDGSVRKPELKIQAMALPDVSKLLEAGERSIRLATPLYEYDKGVILDLTGLVTMHPEISSSKPDVRKNITNSGIETRISMEEQPLRQIINNKGSPAFVVMEIELDHPLVAMYEDTYLDGLCTKHLPPTLDVNVGASNDVEGGCGRGRFCDAVGRAAAELRKAREHFQRRQPNNEYLLPGESRECAFMRYLQYSGTEARVMATLEDPTAQLLAEYKQEELSKTYARMARQIRATLETNLPSFDQFHGLS